MSDAQPDRQARLNTPQRPVSTPSSAARRTPRRGVARGLPELRRQWRSGDFRRILATAVLSILTATTALLFTPALPASAATPATENASARAAVMQLIGPRPTTVTLPGDFTAEAGYQPVVSDGLLVDPHGDCSSPIQLPPAFDNACRAHDLGYDMLRYAQNRHQPLGPWARQGIDAAFQQRIQTACEHNPDTVTRTRCDVLATVAGTGVDLNSRRQNYATPRPEYLFGAQLSGQNFEEQLLHIGWPVAAGVVVIIALGTTLVLRNRRRRVNLG